MFGVPFLILAVLAYWVSWAWVWMPSMVVAISLMIFFRDPPRRGSSNPRALRSPADGRVVSIEENTDPSRGPVPGKQVAIFLSVLNCHINRAPCAGVIERVRYEPGKFLDARDPNAGKLNESNWIFMIVGERKVTVRQISGLIARRIVCRVREGQSVRRGQRLGLIRFGSRTEIYLPDDVMVRVQVGQNVKGGLTDIAEFPQ